MCVVDDEDDNQLKENSFNSINTPRDLWNEQIPYSDESFENVTAFLTQVVNQEHRPTLKPDCPQPYVQLVSSCLQSDPHSRPSFSEISSSVYGVE